jgi:3'-phosphoadenosine 5'-phosphosulfate sulfotransferase (PAPS reductase)/FAD synthetase
VIGEHNNAVLQFSGGKDSTALLFLAKPHLDRITVLFAETGATFPHVRRHVEQTCEQLGAKLEIVHPPVDVFEHTKRWGLPSDIVPVEASIEAMHFLNPPRYRDVLQPYTQCCGNMIWLPMLNYMREHKVDLVLRGSKQCDDRVGVGPEVTVEGITYSSPLWQWTDEQVYGYLREQKAELPAHYPKISDSLDCWVCTAHLAHHGAEKLAYLREQYPELWPIVADRLTRVRDVLISEGERVAPAFHAL